MSMAGLTCYKPGKRSRMFYSVREYRGRKGEPKGIGWRDVRDLLVRAHIQLGGSIVLVWDNLRMHLVEPMRDVRSARPRCAPRSVARAGTTSAGQLSSSRRHSSSVSRSTPAARWRRYVDIGRPSRSAARCWVPAGWR